MQPSIINQISAEPSLKWVVLAVIFHILNAFLGAFMAFMRKGLRLLGIHGILYCAVLFCLGCFLLLNGNRSSIGEYLVCAYFIIIIPISKRWDVILHAFVSVVGLLLLPLLIILNIAW
ncbi:MAG: hypothetical protein A3K09_08100 [Nitrospinae bacterium RIFCSPLOWO2_12_FULL_47_7]|nr:MAG: hypothetical protein A3K09_08100 [Nitrospinae bacterium RIFCSPLOWO2_12_FULL_47_7]